MIANIWTKMKAIYPMVGGTATTHKFNLKNPLDTNAAFRLQFFGGGTHSANGYQPNGVDAYADTFLIPSTTLSLTNTHACFYSRTNNTSNIYMDLGTNDNSSSTFRSIYISPFISNLFYGVANSATTTSVANTNTTGFYLVNRTSSTTQSIQKNSTITSASSNSQGLSVNSINIGRWNNPGPPLGSQYYSPRECAFASIGDGLSNAEGLSFYNAIQTFQTTLGRQV